MFPKKEKLGGLFSATFLGEEVTGTMGILGRSFKTPLPLTGPCSSPLPYKQQPHADGGTWHELPAKPSVIRLPRCWRPLSGGPRTAKALSPVSGRAGGCGLTWSSISWVMSSPGLSPVAGEAPANQQSLSAMDSPTPTPGDNCSRWGLGTGKPPTRLGGMGLLHQAIGST